MAQKIVSSLTSRFGGREHECLLNAESYCPSLILSVEPSRCAAGIKGREAHLADAYQALLLRGNAKALVKSARMFLL
jgi:hypothetical protein